MAIETVSHATASPSAFRSGTPARITGRGARGSASVAHSLVPSRGTRSDTSPHLPEFQRRHRKSVETPQGYAVETGCWLIGPGLLWKQPRQEALVYHHMYGDGNSGWNWLWMIPMVILWLAVLGGVVYAAVRLALQHSRRPPLGQ